MSSYSKQFENPYPDGWENAPSEETPITADALQSHTDAIEGIDDYLYDNPIPNKNIYKDDAIAINNNTIGKYSFAFGNGVAASGLQAHAEGQNTLASGQSSHAEGDGTRATMSESHAEGWQSQANGKRSHAEGQGTYANANEQHTQGRWNVIDTESKYAHIVGNGTSSARSNAHTLDWDGNAWFSGDVEDGSGNKLSSVASDVSELKSDIVDIVSKDKLVEKTSVNISDYDTLIKGGYITENGNITSATEMVAYSQKLKVNYGTKYCMYKPYAISQALAEYGSDNSFIRIKYVTDLTVSSENPSVLIYTPTDSNVKYIAFNTTLSNANPKKYNMFCIGESYPSAYEYSNAYSFKSSYVSEAVQSCIENNIYVGETKTISGVTMETISVGTDAIRNDDLCSVAIGTKSLGKTRTDNNNSQSGLFNTAIGNLAMENATTSNHSTAVGFQSMRSVTSGEYNTALGEDSLMSIASGSSNVAVGCRAMQSANSGNDNVAIGQSAMYWNDTAIPNGSRNVAIGSHAGAVAGSGCDNVQIGYYAKVNSTVSNTIVIGSNVNSANSNEIKIGSSAHNTVIIADKKIIFNSDGTVTWESI